MSAAERERNLLRYVAREHLVEKAARFYARRFHPFAREDDLLEIGNFALAEIVRGFPADLGGFRDYCRQKLGRAMLDAIRVEARHHRVEQAARRAAAELLAMSRAQPGVAPLGRIEELAANLAAATFVASLEEGQRGGDDELADRQMYVTAHVVLTSALAALPRPLHQVLVMLYVDGAKQEQAAKALGVHVNTIQRRHEKALAEIRSRLERAGIKSAPTRSGGPRLVALAHPANDEGADEKDPRD